MEFSDEQMFELTKQRLQQESERERLAAEQSLAREMADHAYRQSAANEMARQAFEYVTQCQRSQSEWVQATLRSALYLNAGAIVILLAFVGITLGEELGQTKMAPRIFVAAFQKFGFGVAIAVLAMGAAYLSFVSPLRQSLGLRGADAQTEAPETWADILAGPRAQWMQIARIGAMILAACAWAAFVAGCADVFRVFNRLV